MYRPIWYGWWYSKSTSYQSAYVMIRWIYMIYRIFIYKFINVILICSQIWIQSSDWHQSDWICSDRYVVWVSYFCWSIIHLVYMRYWSNRSENLYEPYDLNILGNLVESADRIDCSEEHMMDLNIWINGSIGWSGNR